MASHNSVSSHDIEMAFPYIATTFSNLEMACHNAVSFPDIEMAFRYIAMTFSNLEMAASIHIL